MTNRIERLVPSIKRRLMGGTGKANTQRIDWEVVKRCPRLDLNEDQAMVLLTLIVNNLRGAESRWSTKVAKVAGRIQVLKDVMRSPRALRARRMTRALCAARISSLTAYHTRLTEQQFWPTSQDPRAIRAALEAKKAVQGLHNIERLQTWASSVGTFGLMEILMNFGFFREGLSYWEQLPPTPYAQGLPVPPELMVQTYDPMDCDPSELVGLASADKGLQLLALYDLASGNLTAYEAARQPLAPINVSASLVPGAPLLGSFLAVLKWVSLAHPKSTVNEIELGTLTLETLTGPLVEDVFQGFAEAGDPDLVFLPSQGSKSKSRTLDYIIDLCEG